MQVETASDYKATGRKIHKKKNKLAKQGKSSRQIRDELFDPMDILPFKDLKQVSYYFTVQFHKS